MMSLFMLQEMLGRSVLIGYGILTLWFVAFVWSGDAIFELHHKVFALSHEHFNLFHYQAMGVFKVLILCFLLAPYLALVIIGSAS